MGPPWERSGASLASNESSLSLSTITTRKPLFSDPRGVADAKAMEAATCDNPVRALKLYEQSAAYGHPGACFECGVFYEAGIPGHLEPNEHKAVLKYLVAAIGGIPSARYNLAFMYERGGGGLATSNERACELFDSAAELGHAGAAAALADRLFRGVVRDQQPVIEGDGAADDKDDRNGSKPQVFFEEAVLYWLLAARAGHPQACMALSVAFTEGVNGLKVDQELGESLQELALLLWWKTASQNDTLSHLNVSTSLGRERSNSREGSSERGGGSRRSVRSPPNSGASSRKDRVDKVLRLPSYFNKAGAAALIKERDLLKRLMKGPRDVVDLLEKLCEKRSKPRPKPGNPAPSASVKAAMANGAWPPLTGETTDTVSALLDFVDTLDDADVLEAASPIADRPGSGGGKKHLSGSFDGSESDKEASESRQRRDNSSRSTQQQRGGGNRSGGAKPNVPKMGPLLPPRFTFRQPSLALRLLKEYKKLTGKRKKQRPRERAPAADNADGGIPPPPPADETDAVNTDPDANGTRHERTQQRVAVSPIRSRNAAADDTSTMAKATPKKSLEDNSTANNVPPLALSNTQTLDVSLPGILSPLEEGHPPPPLNKSPSWRNQRKK